MKEVYYHLAVTIKREALSVDIPVGPRLKVAETQFQFLHKVSIHTLLSTRKLVQPTFTKRAVLNFELLKSKQALGKMSSMTVECKEESMKFSSGVFQDAFHATTVHGDKWVLKTYNQKDKNTISETVKSTVENHCRKQVQMSCIGKAPLTLLLLISTKFGKCFKYNRCY